MDSKEQNGLRVLMFPWVAHGHLSPYLEIAKKLCQHNFYIYFCSTPINLCSIKEQITTKTFPSIQLVELHLPALPNLPRQYHTTKSLPPHLMPSLMEAFDMAQSSFSNLLKSLKPDLLIYDLLQPWAPRIASDHNIPAVHFITMGAAATCSLIYACRTPSVEFPFPSIYLHEHEHQKLAPLIQSNDVRFMESIGQSSGMMLIKTSEEIEAKYIEHLSYILGGMEVLPLGILVQEEPTRIDEENKVEHFMSWLGKKGKGSTVFVSFGSEYYMSKEEIEEIAHGLELSGVSFIWVIRFHAEEEIKEVEQFLPQGFLERVGERGMVVKGWAPQIKILGHSSIGGFVSHCGWSSVIESLRYGVPLIPMPMQIDQPFNARLTVELGVGVEVKRTDEGKIHREEMAKVIKEVVVENGGELVRRRMREISLKMRDGGEMDIVVHKLRKLIEKKHDPNPNNEKPKFPTSQ